MAAAVAMMVDQTQTLESRVARIESDVDHICSDIADMKLDIRELRKAAGDIDDKISKLDLKFTSGLLSNRVWMLLQSAALLGVLAKAFKWL